MQKFSINLVKSFLIAFIRFARIISLIKNSFGKNSLSFAEGVLWERGVSRSNPLYLDCHDFLRSLAMTIKNNLEILNSVKTFLTSITFDSLSRKIKNPCLVINKNSFSRRKLSCIISKNFLPTWL